MSYFNRRSAVDSLAQAISVLTFEQYELAMKMVVEYTDETYYSSVAKPAFIEDVINSYRLRNHRLKVLLSHKAYNDKIVGIKPLYIGGSESRKTYDSEFLKIYDEEVAKCP